MDRYYKNIVYKAYDKISMFEFDFYNNNIHSREEYIYKMSIFRELIGYVKLNYILVNKKNNEFLIDGTLLKFTNHILLDRIDQDYGVKNIFILLKEDEYNRCRKNTINKALVYKNRNDIFRHIWNSEKLPSTFQQFFH